MGYIWTMVEYVNATAENLIIFGSFTMTYAISEQSNETLIFYDLI